MQDHAAGNAVQGQQHAAGGYGKTQSAVQSIGSSLRHMQMSEQQQRH
jgi:hypothetical protein